MHYNLILTTSIRDIMQSISYQSHPFYGVTLIVGLNLVIDQCILTDEVRLISFLFFKKIVRFLIILKVF